MTSWSSSVKIWFYKFIECIIRHGVKQNAKYVPLVKQNVMKQNVMKLEVIILGGQRIGQRRKKGWWRGRRERIENGSRERIEIERKETKGNLVCNLKRRIRNIDICLCLLFSFLKALRFS